MLSMFAMGSSIVDHTDLKPKIPLISMHPLNYVSTELKFLLRIDKMSDSKVLEREE